MKFSFLILSEVLILAFGQNCSLSSGKIGYCRENGDCFGAFQGYCQDGFTCCETSEKSIEKCKDYGKYVYKTVSQEVLTVSPADHNVSECSLAAIPLIVGGLKAKPKEFPHMVAIGYGHDIEKVVWLCGGSLISENFVLTAAHCSETVEWGPATFVRLGVVRAKNPEHPHYQDLTMSEIIIHPKYKAHSRYNDIALCRLSGTVKMNVFVRPACLHVTSNEFGLKMGTATGWGKLKYDANEVSQDLMKVDLHFIDTSKCNSTFLSKTPVRSLSKGILPSQFCAGEQQGGKDTCYGDSGGPFQVLMDDPYCMYSIVGITSFGRFCGFKNSPAVYTRVSYFVPWIESVVWP